MGPDPDGFVITGHGRERTERSVAVCSAAVYRSPIVDRTTLRNTAVLFALVTLLATACRTQAGDTQTDEEEHAHLEVAEAPEGQQAYALIDGRAGFRRMPLVDVSHVELLDHGGDAAGLPFAPIAPPGEILLLFFGYTSCPDVCPTTLADFGLAVDSMPSELAERTTFGMVSIDPERDDGERIDGYVSLFIDDGHALLAADAEGLATATEAFGVVYEIEEHEAGATDYLVGHTANVFAVDEDGVIIWEIGYLTPTDEIAATLEDLFAERY